MTTPQPPDVPGTPAPWSYPHETDLAAPTPDVLVSPAEEALHKGRRRRTPLILVSVAAAVALLLGGGAYAGVRLWYGSGAQPEEATPAGVLAFARLDLSPGYGQRLKINNLLKKFPRQDGKDAAEELTQGIFDLLGIDEAAYREHVEPWFGDRIGVSAWLDDTKQRYGLIVLATNDEAAARTGLARLRDRAGAQTFGFRVQHGFALVARGERDAQDAAEAAAEEAARESLADAAQFRDDVDWLPDRQAAIAWIDLALAGEAMTEAMRDAFSPFDNATPGMFGGSFLRLPFQGGASAAGSTGRLVVGAQAADDGVEIRMRAFDTATSPLPASADARSTVDALPANSAIAGSIHVGQMGRLPDRLLPDADPAVPEDLLKALPPEEADLLRQQMAQAQSRTRALSEAFSAIGGAKISLAVSKVDGPPALAAAAETSSAEKAGALADTARLLGDDVSVTTNGTRVELTTKGYAADGGTLAGQALYREALRGAPEHAAVVVYVDIQRLVADADMTEQERREMRAVKAVGLASGTEDGDEVVLARLVIK